MLKIQHKNFNKDRF